VFAKAIAPQSVCKGIAPQSVYKGIAPWSVCKSNCSMECFQKQLLHGVFAKAIAPQSVYKKKSLCREFAE
jgi:hypothetical protein